MAMGLKTVPFDISTIDEYNPDRVTKESGFYVTGDVVVVGASLEEHNNRLEEKEVTFLSHVAMAFGLKLDPAEMETIKTYPQPKTTTQLKAFIDLIGYYRRFIRNFSKIAKPLHSLLKKGVLYD
ncbi:uncharacterized mitochondrial protein AtMg00860-like [Schistocerca piceifrons]|uniref:uncharacterized mitochondrial protein AtMg00860-like n=1 Tax=Schistocerca piceifrons TaxID=274613 RepID=UPI001F5EE042|nr:uncharacterized mitochondrial protein AtMg00860-like [Schistocerca piceifrons]